MGLLAVQRSLEAAEVGPEAGPVVGAEAAAGTAEVPGRRSRPHQSSDSGCEAEAAEVAAGERRVGEDRGRSLLAQLPRGCPAGAAGARHRAESEPGWRRGEAGRNGASDKQGGERDKGREGWREEGGRKMTGLK